MNFKSIVLVSVAICALPVSAQAAVVSLNFEDINATYPSSNFAQILEYYNGGASSQGTSGTNYGISFSSNALALCLNTPNNNCSSTSRGGLGDPASQRGGLFFTSGNETFLNYAAGFDTGFSFFYSAISSGGPVIVYDGLNGTGNVLATLNLSTTPSSCPGEGAFCPFIAAGVTFGGTARSIGFGGVANQIVFDDVTFGSATPGTNGAVPEPSTWAMMIGGFGAIGGALRYRRRKTGVSFA